MDEERTHRVTSAHGPPIAGRVVGQGPPLVLVHGAFADGGSEWTALVPLLAEGFTCYLPSTRGRGASGAHPDVSREARVGDLVRFIEAIGAPVGLVGVSRGATLALGVAARTEAIRALVAIEPECGCVLGAEERRRVTSVLEQVDAAVARGEDGVAAWPLVELIANDEELDALSQDPQGLEGLDTYLPLDLAEIHEELDGDRGPTDPASLARITAPTLLLHGSRTAWSWFTDGARHVARHVPGADLHEIADNGHLGHLLHPDRVAAQLGPFLERRGDGGSGHRRRAS